MKNIVITFRLLISICNKDFFQKKKGMPFKIFISYNSDFKAQMRNILKKNEFS